MAAERVSAGSGNTHRIRVFLSYSRKDQAFASRLAEALGAQGYVADFDRSASDPANVETGISAEDDWWKRLQEMIAAAEAMVFIVSPDSAASPVCGEEIAYARALGKRVIPVLLRTIDFRNAPPRLAALNVKLSFEDGTDFEASLAALADALDVDVAWHREGSRLLSLAVKWDNSGRTDSLLLPGAAVIDAETWAARRPAKVEQPGELLRDYLDASSGKAKADRERLLTITGRAFVKPAEQALAEGRHDAALRLAAAGLLLGEDFDFRLVPERVRSVMRAAEKQALRCVLHGHEHSVGSAAFSADGTRVLTTSSDITARIWDAASGRELAAVRDYAGWVASASFSTDGERIVIAGDNVTRIFNARSACEELVLRGHQDSVSFAAFSADATLIATASEDRTVRLWDAKSGGEIAVLRGRAAQKKVSFSTRGTHLLTCAEGNEIHLWDVLSRKELGTLPGYGASFSPDGQRVLTVGYASGVKVAHVAEVWDTSSRRKLAVLSAHEDMVMSAEFDPAGSRIVTASSDGTARIWDSVSGHEIRTLRGHTSGVGRARFSPDGTRIITAGSLESRALIWDALSGDEIVALCGHERGLLDAQFSPDGRRVVTASMDRTARIWDAAAGREIVKIHEVSGDLLEVANATFSQDGNRIRVALDDGTTRSWDAVSGLRVHEREECMNVEETGNREGSGESDADDLDEDGNALEVDNLSVRNLPANGDGPLAIVTRGNEVAVQDLASGYDVMVMRQNGHVRHASFSPDGTRMVTVATSGVEQEWEMPNASIVGFVEADTAVVWDTSRTPAIAGDPVEVLAASLANGRGFKPESEDVDLLMKAAPNDLYEALMAHLSPAKRQNVVRRTEIFARALHQNCYLPASSRPGRAAPAQTEPSPLLRAAIVGVHSASRSSASGSSVPRKRGGALVFFGMLLIVIAVGLIWLISRNGLQLN